MSVYLGAVKTSNFKKEFKIYKKGITNGKVTIVSKKSEAFNKEAKIRMYQYLQFKVYDLNDNEIK